MPNNPIRRGRPPRTRVSLGRIVAAAALVASAFATMPSPARAEPPIEPEGPPHIDPSLDDVAVASPGHDRALAAVEQTRAGLSADEERLADARRNLEDLDARRGSLDDDIAADTKIRDAAESELFVLGARLRGLALQAYVGISDHAGEDAALSLDHRAFLRARSSTTMRQALTTSTYDSYRAQQQVAEAATERLGSNRRALDTTRTEIARTHDVIVDAEESIAAHEVALVTGLAAVRDARATALVEGTDLPLVALDAYVAGARAANERTPGCHLDWSLLAGIGKVESGQGTHGGAALRADGTLTRPIHGVPLDGSNGNERIPTADGFMRAEGPMQFLPSTWRNVAVDGDGDDEADIQNLYDAAATAGAYLCRDGRDLSGEADRRIAILTYNFSGAYVDKVTAAMARYADALPDLTGL